MEKLLEGGGVEWYNGYILFFKKMVLTMGSTLGITAGITENLQGKFSYTYLDPGENTTGRPGNKADISLKYAGNKFDVFLAGQHVSSYYAADNSQNKIDDYFIANTKINYKIAGGLKVFVAIDNIFDLEYKIYANLPGGSAGLYSMPKRTFTTGLSYKF